MVKKYLKRAFFSVFWAELPRRAARGAVDGLRMHPRVGVPVKKSLVVARLR
jgi:hypothetical protein